MKNKDRPQHRCVFLKEKERVYLNDDGTLDFYQGKLNYVYSIDFCPRCGRV